jgi:hypothetical protein
MPFGLAKTCAKLEIAFEDYLGSYLLQILGPTTWRPYGLEPRSAVRLAEGLEPANGLLGSICRTQNHPDAGDSDRRRDDALASRADSMIIEVPVGVASY